MDLSRSSASPGKPPTLSHQSRTQVNEHITQRAFSVLKLWEIVEVSWLAIPGWGKTTLTRILGEQIGIRTGCEEIGIHPFQRVFKTDPRYALANQVDFLLRRAEQEHAIRQADRPGILDGGLEMDFHVFSRLFHCKGWLTDAEMSLLDRFYLGFRKFLPMPEVVIYLEASIETITERFLRRERSLEIASLEDLPVIDMLIRDWLGKIDPEKVITMDANPDYARYSQTILSLSNLVKAKLGET